MEFLRSALPYAALTLALLVTAAWTALLGYGTFQMAKWVLIPSRLGWRLFHLPAGSKTRAARNSLVMAGRYRVGSRKPCSISRLRSRSVFIGKSRQCRHNTGGIQARHPYAMNATLLRMAMMRRRRISVVKNVRSTIAEARYPAKLVIVMAQDP